MLGTYKFVLDGVCESGRLTHERVQKGSRGELSKANYGDLD